ncbi:MAG: 30S ribosomal protein S17 [Clostridia bacterium]|nr:30S ribosomal protein S17 [Clostridia bacterium]
MLEKKELEAQKPQKEKIRKSFQGFVIGIKNDKTILVRVESVRLNRKYKKRYTVNRNYQVHDEKNSAVLGQKISFVECRPYSKTKRWRLIES